MTNFMPEPVKEKRNKKSKHNKTKPDQTGDNHDNDNDEDEAMVEEERNLNMVCSEEYAPSTKQAMCMIGENEVPYDLVSALLSYITGLHVPGAVLIFMPGWSQIFSLLKHLQQHPEFGGPGYTIIPLHSQLPREDQRTVFQVMPEGVTKIVIATNIAETSITIEDVVFVIDSGKHKVKMFTAHNNMVHYATSWASKSNLLQRRGRAGRVRPGFCFHLVSRARYDAMPEHMVPEILRTPLHELCLSIKLLRLGPVGTFLSKCVQSPPIDAVIEAEVMLRQMLAIDTHDELTPLGRILARLPVEPRLGKMMILGTLLQCGDAMTTITAAASTGAEVFMTDLTNGRLMQRQKNFAGSRYSDHVATLHVFQSWDNARQAGERSEVMFCDQKSLNMPALRVMCEAKIQLRDILINCGFPEQCFIQHDYLYHGHDPHLDLVIGLLVMGLYPNVCMTGGKRKVYTTEAKVALIHKSSVNCSREDVEFPEPLFVFSEKQRTRTISCKGMTMVSPLQLMLFGARKIDLQCEESIKLDNWINISMSPHQAALVTALRPALETLIIRCAADPASVTDISNTEIKTIDVIKQLVRTNAGRHNLEQTPVSVSALKRPHSSLRPGNMNYNSSSYEPDAQRGRAGGGGGFNSMFGGRGYGGGFRGTRGYNPRGGGHGHGGSWRGGFSRGRGGGFRGFGGGRGYGGYSGYSGRGYGGYSRYSGGDWSNY